MNKNIKENKKYLFILVLFGVVVFLSLQHLSSIFDFIGVIFSIVKPLLWGFVIAFVLNVPMRAIENLIDKIRNRSKKTSKNKECETLEVKPMNLKLKRAISFTITIVLLLVIVSLIGVIVIPKMAQSIVSIYVILTTKMPEIIAKLGEFGIDIEMIYSWIDKFDIKEFVDFLSQKNFDLFDFLFGVVGSTVSGVISFGIALVIAIYSLLYKESIVNVSKKLITVHMKEKHSNFLLHIGKLINERYAKFLSGQFIESCILGTLMFVVLKIIGVPYSSLIGVLTAVSAFIPYFGAFFSCGVGAFLVLLVKPEMIIIYIIAYALTQFVENQFIYPHVVGTSVGLNPLLTLSAVFIGGKLLGVFGMVFFIPLVSVIVTLIEEYTEKKQKKKSEEKEKILDNDETPDNKILE